MFRDIREVGFLRWLEQPQQIAFFSVFFIILAWIITKISARRKKGLRIRDPGKGHRWHHNDFLDKPTYCNVCEISVVRGWFCDTCWICVHDECEVRANHRFACKVSTLSRRTTMRHHWIQGNLPLCSKCAHCQSPCGIEPRLADHRCLWCQRTVHDNSCFSELSSECDFGCYRELVIPPYCMTLKTVGWRGRKCAVVKEVINPAFKKWTPLLVFANPKSGGNEGLRLLKACRGLLNPAQVFDLTEISPEAALEFCQLLPDVQFRILICGGDGTIGWVLDAIDKLAIEIQPYVAMLPLGTGNDLARSLGWGVKYVGDEHELEYILTDIEEAHVTPLDRWDVAVEHSRYFGMKPEKKELRMNSYFSLGCDAQVTLNFHKHRESQPFLFTSRMVNKLMYFIYGSRDVLEQECKNLHERIELELDGKKLDLPYLESIVVLNIGSWCGGCDIWYGCDNMPKPSFSDGVLEVAGLTSSLHIARIRVNLASPLWLGQAKSVKITLKGSSKSKKVPMQVDGEPWEQGPCSITITQHGQAMMLQRTHDY